MIPYEVCVTAVSDRMDLFRTSIESLLANVDQKPTKITVHIDMRPEAPEVRLADFIPAHPDVLFSYTTTEPANGMGPALVKLLEAASADFVLYTQEDWLVLRELPVRRTLELMTTHNLNHVRWNKRKTMRAKHEDDPTRAWKKVEVQFGGQTMCVSDHWYTQTSMWHVAAALPFAKKAAESAPDAHHFVARLNDLVNAAAGAGRKTRWNDQAFRHERVKTYIWGGIGEPAFVKHIGSLRGTGHIKNHLLK